MIAQIAGRRGAVRELLTRLVSHAWHHGVAQHNRAMISQPLDNDVVVT
jgi:hypothetical protein